MKQKLNVEKLTQHELSELINLCRTELLRRNNHEECYL